MHVRRGSTRARLREHHNNARRRPCGVHILLPYFAHVLHVDERLLHLDLVADHDLGDVLTQQLRGLAVEPRLLKLLHLCMRQAWGRGRREWSVPRLLQQLHLTMGQFNGLNLTGRELVGLAVYETHHLHRVDEKVPSY